jgi:hypothetical protein
MIDPGRFDRLSRVLVLAALAGAVALLLVEAPLSFLVERAMTLGAGAFEGLAVVAGALLLGVAVLPRSARTGLCLTETALFAYGCGAALLSCVFLALGLAGALGQPGIAAVLLTCAVAGCLRIAWPRIRRVHSSPSEREHPAEAESTGPLPRPDCAKTVTDGRDTVAAWFLSPLIACAVLLLVVATYAPPLLYDVTEYHLGALPDYEAAGQGGAARFVPMPHSMYARFPFPVESLYFAGALLNPPRDVAPKVINAAFVLANALLMHAISGGVARRRGRTSLPCWSISRTP